MAGDPTYQKYGGFGTPDMAALVAGQKAVGDGFKEAFSGVDDLLTQTEEIYKKNNTLNMQEYLQSKIKEQGLRAEPLDKTAIQKQFGSMVDMDQLENTFASAKQKIELDALNDVSQEADQVFSETGDKLKARQTLEKRLKEKYNPTPEYLGRALQSWTDANAVKILDMENQNLRDKEIGYSNVRADVRTGADGLQAIEAHVQTLPKHKQDSVRREWTEQYEKDKELTQTQIDTRDYYTNKLAQSVEQDLTKISGEIAQEKARHAALQNRGVQGYAVEAVEGINKTLGGSAKNAIRDKLDNGWQKAFGVGVGPHFDKLHKELTEQLGVSDSKADAILVQAFNAEYRRDGFLFKGMDGDDIKAAKNTAYRLAAEEAEKVDSSNRLTDLRISLGKEEKAGLTKVADFRRRLNLVGQNRRLGVEGASTIEDTSLDYFNQKIDRETAQLTGKDSSQQYPELAPELTQRMTEAESQYDLPSGYMARTAQLESSNRPDAINKDSNAAGLYQFTHKTAAEYGVDPMDPMASIDAMARFTDANRKTLTSKLGRAPTDAELYLAHVQGATGAYKLLTNPDSLAVDLLEEDAVLMNRGSKEMKAGEFASIFLDKYSKSKAPSKKGSTTKSKIDARLEELRANNKTTNEETEEPTEKDPRSVDRNSHIIQQQRDESRRRATAQRKAREQRRADRLAAQQAKEDRIRAGVAETRKREEAKEVEEQETRQRREELEKAHKLKRELAREKRRLAHKNKK